MAKLTEHIYRAEVIDHSQGRREEEVYLESALGKNTRVKMVDVFILNVLSSDSRKDIEDKILPVFHDPVINDVRFSGYPSEQIGFKANYVVEVMVRPGVTDNSALTAREGLGLVDLKAEVASGKAYFLATDLPPADVLRCVKGNLANDLIEEVKLSTIDEFLAQNRFQVESFPKVKLNSEPRVEVVDLNRPMDELLQLSKDMCLALSAEELQVIKDYYQDPKVLELRSKKGLPAAPTDVEIEILAQTWSEHCKHKIFNAEIDYEGPDGSEKINSLFKSFVRATTDQVVKEMDEPWTVSVFHDNAGTVRFDKNVDVSIKVETHNSPSALDPYGGSLTGILGVNRDILGCGMGARPIANLDVFCLGPVDWREESHGEQLPANVPLPLETMKGVHKGVEHGGNRSGIPTVNGSFYFDPCYVGKPLVFVGTVGVLPHRLPDGRDASHKEIWPGDCIFVVGGAVGRDGIHGATFSSMELDESSPATAVQIGDPLTQKRVTDFLLVARDKGMYRAVTDNGAGGISSSIGEMAEMSGGAKLELSLHHTKYPGLMPWEIMVSESQERMTFAVAPELAGEFAELALKFGVDAVKLGEFTASGTLEVHYKGEIVADLPMSFLHDGLPKMKLPARWQRPQSKNLEQLNLNKDDIRKYVERVNTHPNVCSKYELVERYDQEVQGATLIRPYTGKEQQTPANSGAIWLWPHGGEKDNAVLIGHGMAPQVSPLDPCEMAKWSVDEAVRNVVVQGGDPAHCCLLDNFCWPDPVLGPANPDGDLKLGQLVETCKGMKDICCAYGMPLVSGKDSMKNDYRGKSKTGKALNISVLPTLLVSSMAKANVKALVTPEVQDEGDLVYLLGKAQRKVGGSIFSTLSGIEADIAKVDTEENMKLYQRYHQLCNGGIIKSGHDVSQGGVITALLESLYGTGLGLDWKLEQDTDELAKTLFDESPGLFVVSIAAAKREEFETFLDDVSYQYIGSLNQIETLRLSWTGGNEEFNLRELFAAWKGALL